MANRKLFGTGLLFALFSMAYASDILQEFVNLSLTEIPFDDIFLNVTILKLSFNNIERLETKIFENHMELIELYLDNNNISYISPMAFYGLHKLELLYLPENDLLEFPDFRNVSILKDIQIQNNSIHTLNAEYLELPMLEILDITGNELTEFNISFKLLELKSVILPGSQLTKVPTFQYALPNLQHLYFGHNNIVDSISCDYFEKIPDIRSLHSAGNSISEVHICGVEQLETLLLENNNLTATPILNNTLLNLKYFYIGSNPIIYIEEGYFNKTPNLLELGLSSTFIAVIFDLSVLPNLRKLDMSYCSLTFVNMNNLMKVKNLEKVYLSGNNLEEIPNMIEMATSLFSSKLSVSLGGNPIDCDTTELCWLKTMWK